MVAVGYDKGAEYAGSFSLLLQPEVAGEYRGDQG